MNEDFGADEQGQPDDHRAADDPQAATWPTAPAGPAAPEDAWAAALPPQHGEEQDAARPDWSAADDRTPPGPTAQAAPDDDARTDGWPSVRPTVATPPRRHRRAAIAGISVLVFGLAMGSAGYLLGSGGSATPSASALPNSGQGQDGPGGFSFTFPGFGNSGDSTSSTAPAAVQRSEAALVDVNTTIDNGQASGAGTGIVLTSSGVVLTNNHVVDGATSISVTDLGNDQTYQAHVVGYDVSKDVAVLQLVGATGLTTATIGAAGTIGETVYAVGNAGGTGGTPTVTSGKITGTGKTLTANDEFNGTSETLHGMLQVSAALISGDSGGALMNGSGEVVGMDTAGSSTPQGDVGGFAVPISTAVAVAGLITHGAASPTVHVGPTAMLGVEILSRASTTGAPVASAVSGSPADVAGIAPGARITNVAGHAVASGADLRATLLTLRPGERVTVQWVDAAGAHHTAALTLASGPAQ